MFPSLRILFYSPTLLCVVVVLFLAACTGRRDTTDLQPDSTEVEPIDTFETVPEAEREYYEVTGDVMVRDYFRWTEAILDSINRGRSYYIDEYVLVHANAHIIDSLRNTDYYFLKDQGVASPDPTDHRFIARGERLYIPDSIQVERILEDLDHTYIDINIPEYKLRIVQRDRVVGEYLIRVGKNERRFLAMAGREVDLRTKPGIGRIIRVNRSPLFINPRDNRRYAVTRRDDDVVTKLPNIPWLEPELDGIRIGQLIHPTTNLSTLGKAASNGCIGLREADAWSLYFYAPVGTEIIIRYDLEVEGPDGQVIMLENIYPGFERKRVQRRELLASAEAMMLIDTPSCYCGKIE